MRLVLLHTSYRVTDIYDWDHGLTATQLEYLGLGIEAERAYRFAEQIQVWTAAAPLLGAASSFGFTGNPDGLNATAGKLRDAARTLIQHRTARAGPPASPPADPAPSSRDVAFAHPMFAANLGKVLS